VTTPVVDLAHLHGQLATEIEEAALRVLRSGHYLRGPETAGLEQEFGAACGAPFAVGVNSGFDALRLALLGLGVGPGDEVVVPSHTAIATWLAVTHTGAQVVPVDPREDTMLVDADAVRAAIGPRTAAVVAVHLYGHVVDIEPLARLARERGLALVEDCAQAHGARDRGADRTVGTAADAGAFSFYPTKNLGGAGDGGMVVTRDQALAERVRMLANYGERERLFSETLGWNSRSLSP
jgi:dTDP-3-amino-3,4,6-trideoxy-alpha-D-glucose transaminase